jgi:chorismate-pyruvate lyase
VSLIPTQPNGAVRLSIMRGLWTAFLRASILNTTHVSWPSPTKGDRSRFPASLDCLGSLSTLYACRVACRLRVAGNRRRRFEVELRRSLEVEAALLELPSIAKAVVLGIPDGAAGKKIKAVLIPNEPVTSSVIREHCKRRLADFKQPKIVEFRKELPRSPLGKIPRKYLIDEVAGHRSLYEFDFRRGFVSASAGSNDVHQALQTAMLPPFLRMLLVTDGTVTKSIEAFFWEPVEVYVLTHSYRPSENEYPEINVKVGDFVVMRRVVLRGATTRTPYAFAESVIGGDCINPEIRGKLIKERKRIGEVLRDSRRETFREVFRIERSKAGEWATRLEINRDDFVVAREYKIYCDHRPTIQIKEIFAESRFRSI